jgi:hypothetical protein
VEYDEGVGFALHRIELVLGGKGDYEHEMKREGLNAPPPFESWSYAANLVTAATSL